jgi:hypothetical protein
MMKKYGVVKVADKKIVVVERNPQNNVVIKTFTQNKPAVALCALLNKGAAFNGWTPPFFLSKKEQL